MKSQNKVTKRGKNAERIKKIFCEKKCIKPNDNGTVKKCRL